MNLFSTARAKRGFSLVEVLIVIAVIGVIAAIGVPVISKVLEKSTETTARRNAQMLAAMFSQVRHAGNEAVAGAPDKETAVAMLVAGVKGAGQMSHVDFQLTLSEDEQENVLPYLTFGGGLLSVHLE